MRRAMGPLVERSIQPGGLGPPAGTRPRLGFMPDRPQQALGMRMEPPPSDPVASGTMPAASAAADPPDDPPGPLDVVERVQRGAEDGVGRVAHPAELGRVGLADDDAAGGPQAGHEGIVDGGGRVVGVERRAVGRACSRRRSAGP